MGAALGKDVGNVCCGLYSGMVSDSAMCLVCAPANVGGRAALSWAVSSICSGFDEVRYVTYFYVFELLYKRVCGV